MPSLTLQHNVVLTCSLVSACAEDLEVLEVLSPSDVMLPKLAACLATPAAPPTPLPAAAVAAAVTHLPGHDAAAAAAMPVHLLPALPAPLEGQAAAPLQSALVATSEPGTCSAGAAIPQHGLVTQHTAAAAKPACTRGSEQQEQDGAGGADPCIGEASAEVPCGRFGVPGPDSVAAVQMRQQPG